MFYWFKQRTTIIEGNFVEDVETALAAGVNTYTGGNNETPHNIDRAAATTVSQQQQQLQQPTDTVTVTKRPDISFVTVDNCSAQSLNHSDYKVDICTKYAGDYETINKKCNALSNESCNYISCCVLLNGSKCVAGDANGPTYLTDQGNAIDYNYYRHRGKVYPEDYNFKPSEGYLKKCGMYANNSTNISKACMIRLFNDTGCTNPAPTALINDATVAAYRDSSKQYIKADLENATKLLKSNMNAGDDDSRILCNGADRNNPCDVFNNNDLDVSKKCMVRMMNDFGCPNKAPSNITDEFVVQYSTANKKTIKNMLGIYTSAIKQNIASNPEGSDERVKNHVLCYGTTE